tara:strand:- start:15 stop:236 length:222 start_codon:yes stop_codon:yes gene_type:complete
MKELLREYWLWILIPIVLIGGLITFVIATSNKSTDNFEYDLTSSVDRDRVDYSASSSPSLRNNQNPPHASATR